MTKTILDDITVTIDKVQVQKRLGFNTKKTILTPEIEKIITEEIARFHTLANHKVIYAHHNIEFIDEETIRIRQTDKILSSEALNKHLFQCHKGTLFACTIGDAIDQQKNDFTEKGEQARAVILDGIGSVAVEALAEKFNKQITQIAYKDRSLTLRRFSPGYKDWRLSEQPIIFSIINPAEIGISLTSRFMMIPEKSITGIIGWKKWVGTPVSK